MKIHIIYATYSSGTMVVSELIQHELEQNGNEVTRVNVKDADPSVLPEYKLILLGSPSWLNNQKDGQPHHDYYAFMEKMESVNVENKNFAVFGLGDSAYARVCGSVDVLEEFVNKIKGKLITESLRIDSFYFDQKNNEQKARDWAHKLG
ncbi:MAG: flavodoxin domain-containing protein [Patescibacteria group bacterium]